MAFRSKVKVFSFSCKW